MRRLQLPPLRRRSRRLAPRPRRARAHEVYRAWVPRSLARRRYAGEQRGQQAQAFAPSRRRSAEVICSLILPPWRCWRRRACGSSCRIRPRWRRRLAPQREAQVRCIKPVPLDQQCGAVNLSWDWPGICLAFARICESRSSVSQPWPLSARSWGPKRRGRAPSCDGVRQLIGPKQNLGQSAGGASAALARIARLTPQRGHNKKPLRAGGGRFPPNKNLAEAP